MWDQQFDELVRSFLPFLPPEGALTEELSLRDLGLDSMGSVELLAAVEDAYGVRLLDEALSLETFATPGTLWRAVSASLAPAVRAASTAA
jgi:acyl carrier protein